MAKIIPSRSDCFLFASAVLSLPPAAYQWPCLPWQHIWDFHGLDYGSRVLTKVSNVYAILTSTKITKDGIKSKNRCHVMFEITTTVCQKWMFWGLLWSSSNVDRNYVLCTFLSLKSLYPLSFGTKKLRHVHVFGHWPIKDYYPLNQHGCLYFCCMDYYNTTSEWWVVSETIGEGLWAPWASSALWVLGDPWVSWEPHAPSLFPQGGKLLGWIS